MGLLSFLSRRAALSAETSVEAEALRARIVTMSALLDDVSAELVRTRRREEAQNARFEQLTGRIDFLARQVRTLDDARKGRGKEGGCSADLGVEEFFTFIDTAANWSMRRVPNRAAPELEAFFVGVGKNFTPKTCERPCSAPPPPTKKG